MPRAAFPLLLLLAAACSAAPVPKGAKKPPALDGKWEVVEMVINGVDVTAMNPDVWVIRETVVTRFSRGRDGSLNPIAPGHANALEREDGDCIDYVFGSSGGLRYPGRFKLDGDDLTLSTAQTDEPRPTDLKPGKGLKVLRFKRVDEEKR